MLKPKLQGELDNQCGVYSLFNVVQLMIGKEITGKSEVALYNELIDSIKDKEFYVKKGMTVDCVIDSFVYIQDFLFRHYKLKTDIDLPFLKKRKLTPEFVIDQLRSMNKSKNSWFIVSFTHPIFHWSVLKKIDKNKIHFFDSHGIKPYPIENILIKKQKKMRMDQLVLDPKEIIWLKVR